MKRFVVPFLLILAGPLQADMITFRSGEHESFSRLVLDIPVGAGWELLQVEGGYVLRMDPSHVFDTSAAFARIPRDRLAALKTDAGAGILGLELDCACDVTAFLFRPDKLVIDIADARPTAASALADARLAVAGPLTSPLELPLVLETPFPSDVTMPDAPFAAAPQRADVALGIRDPFASALAVEQVAATQVAEIERSLVESFARANAQGVIAFDRAIAFGLSA